MAIFRMSDSVRRTETPDGGVLLDVERGQIFSLNVLGAKIIGLIEQGYDEANIAEEIGTRYAVDPHVLRSDLIDFIETLVQHHIIQPSHSPAGS